MDPPNASQLNLKVGGTTSKLPGDEVPNGDQSEPKEIGGFVEMQYPRPIKMIIIKPRGNFLKRMTRCFSACGIQYSQYATSSHDHSIKSSPYPQKPLLSSFKVHLCRFHPIQRMTLTFKNQHLNLLLYTPHIDPFRGVPTLQRMIKFNSMRR